MFLAHKLYIKRSDRAYNPNNMIPLKLNSMYTMLHMCVYNTTHVCI